VLAFVASLLPAPAAPAASTGTGGDAARLQDLLERAARAYAGVWDYTAILKSRERVGDVLEPEKSILLKFQRPFKVYLRWLEGGTKGREGLYVAGAHGGKFLLVEPRGLARLFTVRLDPTDPRLMARSRHPVTDVGLGRLLEMLEENLRPALAAQALQVHDQGARSVAGRPAWEVAGELSRKAAGPYGGCRIVLAFDQTHHLPIRVVVHDGEGRLLEDYTYDRLTLNPGFTARDFDVGNPEYAFARGGIRRSPGILAGQPN
jgi:hypothetical protein